MTNDKPTNLRDEIFALIESLGGSHETIAGIVYCHLDGVQWTFTLPMTTDEVRQAKDEPKKTKKDKVNKLIQRYTPTI